jgi:autotransporter-associated beta strand protein
MVGHPATFNLTTANEVNWTGGTGVYTDPGVAAVTFDDTGDATAPINVVGTLQPTSVTVNNSVNSYTFAGSGDISGSTGITKSGTGTLTVSNANSYSGSTFVNAGTLVMANPAALGNNTGLIRFPASSTGTLRVSTDGSDTPYQIGSNSGTADLVNDTWSTDFTIASDLATPGAGITHSLGELSLALARLNIVAGPNVSGGAPGITFSSMIATSGVTNPPAKINPTTATVSIGNVTTLNNTAKTLILGGTSTGNAITGNIVPGPGTLAVTKTDTSTWTLSGANTYTGVTTVNGGTLLNGSATTFANTGDLDVDGTGILDLNGFDASFTNLTDDNTAGTITNSAVGSAMITLANAADDDDHLKSAEFTGNLTLSIANSNSSASLAGLRTTNSFTGGLILRDGSGFASTTVGTRLRILAAITGTPFGTGPITIGEANTDKAGMMMDTVANTISNNIVFNTALGTDVPGLRLDSVGNVVSGQITANLADATFSAGGTSTGSATLTGKITGPSGLAMTPAASATTSTLTLTLNNAALDNDYAGNTTISKASSSAYTLTLGAVNQIPNGVARAMSSTMAPSTSTVSAKPSTASPAPALWTPLQAAHRSSRLATTTRPAASTA